MNKNILIVEDDKSFGERIYKFLSKNSFNPTLIENLESLYKLKNISSYQYAISDLRLREESGLNAVEFILKENSNCHIVILSGFGTINSAVEAMKMGAKNFLTKPANGEEILKALEINNFESEKQIPKVPTLEEKEKEFILSSLEVNKGNVSKTAKELGLHRRSLQRKLTKLIGI